MSGAGSKAELEVGVPKACMLAPEEVTKVEVDSLVGGDASRRDCVVVRSPLADSVKGPNMARGGG